MKYSNEFNTELPSKAEINHWRERWTDERANEVVKLLKKYPRSGVFRITRLPWYNDSNGFIIADMTTWTDEVWPRFNFGPFLNIFQNYGGGPRIDLRGCPLHGVDLSNVCFVGAALDGAWLKNANLEFCQFFFCSLDRAHLRHSHLDSSMLFGTSARYSNLSDTIIHSAKLFLCDLSGANLYNSQFLDCEIARLDLINESGKAKCDQRTVFGVAGPIKELPIENPLLREHLPKKESDQREAELLFAEIHRCFRENNLIQKSATYYEQREYWHTRAEFSVLRGAYKNHGLSAHIALRFIGLALRLLFAERLIGYGERPERVVKWSVSIILVCAVIFSIFGFEYNGELKNAATFTFMEWLSSIPLCVRFSIECFTTLGFSKMQPAEGLSHWIASLEGLIGVLFIALATVTWARKAIRD